MLEAGAVASLNHLLRQNAWAAARLAPFAGQCVEFRCPPFPSLRLRILDGGLLERAPDDAAGALVVKLNAPALPLLLLRDEAALGQVGLEGSAALAEVVRFLFRNLRWDIEEDLSKLLGDVVAHRVVAQGEALAGWQREAATRLAQNLAEYWTEEQPLLARPAEVAKFRAGVEALADEVTRLEQRLARLESPAKR